MAYIPGMDFISSGYVRAVALAAICSWSTVLILRGEVFLFWNVETIFTSWMESESPNIQTESADASGDTAGCDVIAVAGADSGCVVGMAATGVVATGVVAAFEAGMAVKANERANVNCSLTSNDFFIQKNLKLLLSAYNSRH